jgi:hypothetical protein
MYARVTTFQIEPVKLDEALEVSRNSILPAKKQQQGFQGILSLVDRQMGKATLWWLLGLSVLKETFEPQ